MDPHAFLLNLATVLGVAAVTTVLCHRVRLPVVFGYLLAGMIVGPHVPLPLVADTDVVRALAELGVILLMFSIGLEFSLGRLVQVGPAALVTALLETGLVGWLGYLAGRGLGWRPLECVFAGAAAAISSTTIVAKVFEERRIEGRLRDRVLGVLVVEDLVAILLLATLTAVGSGRVLSGTTLLATIARLAGFLVAVASIGLLVVPRFMRTVVRLGRPETTLVSSVGLCFGLALLADKAGHSVALGAFLAGTLVAESGEEREVERLVRPVRDIFTSIFFVAVGMLLNPLLLAQNAGAVAVFVAVVVVGKIVGVSAGALLSGASLRTSVRTGMSLAQIGEFSFIIAGVGLATGATRGFHYPVMIAVSATTTLLTPWIIGWSDPVAAYVDRRLPKPVQTYLGLYGSWIERLTSTPAQSDRAPGIRRLIGLLLLDAALLAGIVVGTSLGLGAIVATVERMTGLGAPVARIAVLAGAVGLSVPFIFGIVGIGGLIGRESADTAFPPRPAGALDTAAAPRQALAVGVQAACVAAVAVPLAAITQPFLPAGPGAAALVTYLALIGFAFRRSAADLQGHVKAGAQVIAEALGRAAHPRRDGLRAGGETLDVARRLLPGIGGPVAIRLETGAHAVGRSLVEMNLRGLTGATVLAIAREGARVVQPTGREMLRAGDVLALAGAHEAIEAAREFLLRGPAESTPPAG